VTQHADNQHDFTQHTLKRQYLAQDFCHAACHNTMTILIKTLLIMTLLITLKNATLLITELSYHSFLLINDFSYNSKK
jgi:hypothetical protein